MVYNKWGITTGTFDVFFELSVDGGASWRVQTDGPGRLTLYASDDPVYVVSPSTWGGIRALYRRVDWMTAPETPGRSSIRRGWLRRSRR